MQRVIQVRTGGHVRRRAGRAAGVGAGAAAARARVGRRPPHLRLRAARLRPPHLLRPLRHQRPRGPDLRPHILGHAHRQLNLVDSRRYYTGERFLTLPRLRSRTRLPCSLSKCKRLSRNRPTGSDYFTKYSNEIRRTRCYSFIIHESCRCLIRCF